MVAGGTPSTSEDRYWLQGDDPNGTPFVAIADMSKRLKVRETAKSLSPEGLASKTMPVGKAGTLLLAMYASVGELAFLEVEATWNQAILGITPRPGLDIQYLYYVLLSMRNDLLGEVRSNTQDNLNARQVGDLWYPKPSLELQQAISAYLDTETSKIDELIGEQEHLVHLLGERRNAVIANAVTRGVKAGVPLSASPVDWIGSTPAHWRSGKVKHAGTVTLGKMLQSSDSGADALAPYLRAANVQPDGVLALDDVKEMWFGSTELGGLDLRAGDVVVVEGGQGGFGRAAYLEDDLDGWGFQNSINRIRPYDHFNGKYITYFLLMARKSGFMRAYCNIVSMPHLTAEKLARMPIPIPPRSEQDEIVDYIEEQTTKIDMLISETKKFVELAKERRSALVTAAVTGQIDVRGLDPMSGWVVRAGPIGERDQCALDEFKLLPEATTQLISLKQARVLDEEDIDG